MNDIAVIGMAGRFPKAKNLKEFWENLRDGVEGVSFFCDEELAAEGASQKLLNDPRCVKGRAVLDDIDLFDAGFFGINPKEAEIMDPQHRLFLECAWEALEDAGYNAEAYDGAIGVFASTLMSNYMMTNLYPNRDLIESVGPLAIRIANDRDFLPMRVSYKLNLKGPSFCVQTACSSSLVGCHLGCRSLLDYQCDIALIGGVSISVPQKTAYIYQEGGIHSPDGHCRAFDADAKGTVSGSGVGVVVLKRLEDALADGDTIHAVIKGSAINNDGAMKVGYTAPSVEGQAEVIALALALAKIEPETISYIEAHGTGTSIGDPIEVEALTHVFRESTDESGFCGLGSVKTNIGHLDAAAGVAGLIKTVLALKHKQIPPSLNYSRPNPEIDFANSPFYVNAKLTDWPRKGMPRRAGVSSFGVGGTNVHAVLEEAPEQATTESDRAWHVLPISARSATALEQTTANLLAHLKAEPHLNIADVAYTLQIGRKPQEQRRMLVCRSIEDAVAALETLDPKRLLSFTHTSEDRSVAFLFPGQGVQYVQMGAELYADEPIFREHVDNCAEILKRHIGIDLRAVLYPQTNEAEAAIKLTQTFITQPAIFVIEYALAKLWIERGVEPQAMIGHSIGEYVAACLAGVFSLEDALALVAARGRLMQTLPNGAMLAVSLSADAVEPLLGAKLSVAAVNAPQLCVVAGPTDAVDQVQEQFTAQGVECRRLHTSHAFHSSMMDPILKAFRDRVSLVRLSPPQIRYLSNVSGTWITPEEATNPNYWVQQIRQTVRFSQGLTELLQMPNLALLEVGPGRALSSLVRNHLDSAAATVVYTSLRHPQEQYSDSEFMLTTLGRLWLAGVPVQWSSLYVDEERRRVPLPTYPFDRKRYWIDPPADEAPAPRRGAGRMPSEAETGEAPATSAAAQDPASGRHARPQLQSAYVAPRNDVEHALSWLWQASLGIEGIGVYDNFFELGGHSLLATQLIARTSELLKVDVALQSFYDEPTIVGMAEHIKTANTSDQTQQNRRIEVVGRDRALPLSFAQQRLWALDQLEPGSARHNMPIALRLDGTLRVAVLEQSLNLIVARHESLRTAFITGDGEPQQVVTPVLDLPLLQVDLQAYPEAEREAEAARLMTEEAQRPFDLSRIPLLRASLLRLGDERYLLLVTIHHIIFDGWSWNVMMQELEQIYTALSTGQSPMLPELPIQYPDFAVWQRERLQGERLQGQLDFWKAYLGGAPALLDLPTDYPRPLVQSSRGAQDTFSYRATLTEALKTLSQQEGVTLFMTLLAAFQTLLYRYSGQPEIVVGSPNAYRNRPETEQLIGQFADILVIRTSLTGSPSFRELLGRVRTVTAQAYAHQDVSFAKIVEVLRPERNTGYHPIFQVMFNFLSMAEGSVDLPDLRLTPLRTETGGTDFDLFLTVSVRNDELRAAMQYNTDVFTTATIARLMRHFGTLLQGIAASPDTPIDHLALLTAEERALGETDVVPLTQRRDRFPTQVQPLGIAVIATFTAEPIEESLTFWMDELNIPCKVQFGPYSQVFQQLLDPTSLLARNDGVNLILLRLEDWTGSQTYSFPHSHEEVERNVREFVEVLIMSTSAGTTLHVVCVCPPSDTSATNMEWSAFLERMSASIAAGVADQPQIVFMSYTDVVAQYDVTAVNDALSDAMGHIPYTPEFLAVLGTSIVRQIATTLGGPLKVIALDSDLIAMSEPNDHNKQRATEIQAIFKRFVDRQARAGRRVCVCGTDGGTNLLVGSNNPVLGYPRQIGVGQVGPAPASARLSVLADQLQIPLNEFVYLSWNPHQCREVRAHHPDMLTLQLPDEPHELSAFLENIWVLEA